MDDSRTRDLARALLNTPSDEECAASLDDLEAYVAAQLAGEAYVERFPSLALHLDSCVACAEVYGQLYEALAGAADLPAPSRIPAPDLTFLPRPADRQATLAEAIERAGAGLRLSLSRLLLDLFAPGQPAALALRSEGPPALLDLALEQPVGRISGLRVQAFGVEQSPEHCDLRVQIELADREWPDLAGITVSIELGGRRHEARSDAWGEVIFAGLRQGELADARLEVAP